MKQYFGFLIFVVFLIGAGITASRSRLAEFSNLQLPEVSLQQTYVQMNVGSTNPCTVTDRAGTTVKRSETDRAKSNWECLQVEEAEGPLVLLAISKKQYSYLFVPFTSVSDLLYPFVYEIVRTTQKLNIPRIVWTHLFLNRQFRGLYLQITLPGDKFSEEHRMGRLELLTVTGEYLVCLNENLRPICPVYSELIGSGVFPRPNLTDSYAFLNSLLSQPSRTYLLPERNSQIVEPFPVPVVLAELIAGSSERYSDERYTSWQIALNMRSYEKFDFSRLFNDKRPEVEKHLRELQLSIEASSGVMVFDPRLALRMLKESPTRQWLEHHS